MTTLILTALILLLICTAAGLIFLVVTMSDQNEDEQHMKNIKKQTESEEREYEIITPKTEKAPEPQKLVISRKSEIVPFSKNTIIVSHELKREFEKALASMHPEEDENVMFDSWNNKEYKNSINSANTSRGSQEEKNVDLTNDFDEFLIGEQILGNDNSQL